MAKVKLGDVAKEYKNTVRENKGLPIVGLEHLEPGEITLSVWDENVDTSFSKGFKKGTMLFGRRRAYLKKAALAPVDGVCSGDIIVIEAIPEKIDPELLPFIIQNDLLFDFAMSRSAGGLSPRVKWKDLKEFQFELPTREEQARLTEILKAAYKVKEAYNKQLDITEEVVKAKFIEIFGRPFLNDKAWIEMSLGEACTYLTDGSHYSPAGEEDGIYPMLTVKNMDSNGFDYSECKYIGEEEYRKMITNGCKPLKNDVLVAKDGSYFKTAFVVENEIEQAVLSSIAILRPNMELLAPRFLREYLMSDEVLDMVEKEYVTGTAVKRVILKKLRTMPVYLPPLDLQEKYVEFAEQCDKSKDDLKKAINSINDVLKSLVENGMVREEV